MSPNDAPTLIIVSFLAPVLLLGGCGFPFFLLDGGGGGYEPVELPDEPLPDYPPGVIRVLGIAADTGVGQPERAALNDARRSLRAILEGLPTTNGGSFARVLRASPERRNQFSRWLESLEPYRIQTRDGMRVAELRVQEQTLRERFDIRVPK